jgi:hypothetical protein
MAMRSPRNISAAIDTEGVGERCETFTTDHGLTTAPADAVAFAFICPKCETSNPLKGDPVAFRNRFFRCMGCTHVIRLDATALDQFLAENPTMSKRRQAAKSVTLAAEERTPREDSDE